MARKAMLKLFLIVALLAAAAGSVGARSANWTPKELINQVTLAGDDLPAGWSLNGSAAAEGGTSQTFYESISDLGVLFSACAAKSRQTVADPGGRIGIIFYFAYNQPPDDVVPFLKGFLWGDNGRPSTSHPERFGVCGRLLVIWYCPDDQSLINISRGKIESRMGAKMTLYPAG